MKICTLQDNLKEGEETLLTYKICYPCFQGNQYGLSLGSLNRLYRQEALQYENTLRTDMWKQALSQYEFDLANGYPVTEYQALQTLCLTMQAECILSLYLERYEFTGGAHGNTIRCSQTWNLQGNRRLTLRELFPEGFDYRSYLFEEILCQIRRDPSIYFDDYKNLVVSTFDEESFYCTRSGVVIYYQQYDIAPYASGIREFCIPYSACLCHPTQSCFYMN